jgi:NADP-dependent 3-hydroxy acid dehydrogenase YdfG
MKSIEGNIVVITGASRGIGAALARRFAEEKTRLVLCSRKKADVDKVAQSLSLAPRDILTLAADVSTSAGVKKLVNAAYKKFGRVDIFINNAGAWHVRPFLKETEADFDWMMNTNLKSVFCSMGAVIPRMKKQGGGQIINISSGAGRIPFRNLSIYCASKAALNMLSAIASIEHRNDNVKICVLSPGPTETDPRKFSPQPNAKVTARQVADMAVALSKQDHAAYSWHVDVRPLQTTSEIPFV